MKKTLYPRLKAYGALAATVATGSVNAGIVYTDVDPDTTIAGNNNASDDYFFVDIDQNGVVDFQIGMFNAQQTSSRTYSWNGVWATGINTSSMATASNGIAYSGVSFGYKMTLPLSAGSSVGASRSFSYYNLFGARSYWSTASGSTGGNGYFGNFAGQGEKYIGLRFFKGGNAHYGWARVQVDSAFYGITLMDFAYESCPGVSIMTGATTGGSGVNMMVLSSCDSAVIGGNTYFTSQWVYDTISTGSCDSVDVIDLTVNYSFSTSDIWEGCDSVVYNGMTYTSDTTWAETFTTAAGCDSILERTIEVNLSSSLTENISINEGDSVMAGGQYQTTSGTYVDSLLSVNGCDSVITTVLTVVPLDGINSLQKAVINVFPNPSNGIFQIDLSGLNSEYADLTITDMKGQVVFQRNNVMTASPYPLNIEKWDAGVYLLSVRNENMSAVIKLIKK